MWPILDTPLCEVAAYHVKDHTIDPFSFMEKISERSKPKGCFWSRTPLGGAARPYMNSNPDATEGADAETHLLCTTMEPESQNTCATWQESSSWQVSKWYAALHIAVLLDIFKNHPALRQTMLSRIANTTFEYEFLLTHAFKASVEKRLGYLAEPVVHSAAVTCSWWGTTHMVTGGYDYFHQSLGEECKGKCDVMSNEICNVRANENGWFSSGDCVGSEKAQDAEACFESYTRDLLEEMAAAFSKDIRQLQAFHRNVTQADRR